MERYAIICITRVRRQHALKNWAGKGEITNVTNKINRVFLSPLNFRFYKTSIQEESQWKIDSKKQNILLFCLNLFLFNGEFCPAVNWYFEVETSLGVSVSDVVEIEN